MTNTPSPLDIRPYAGTVTVRYMDAVLASTHGALVVNHAGVRDQLFIPFDDIYFDLLVPSPTRETCAVKGEASLWTIQAVGRAEPDAMRVYGANEASARLRDYGAFDPDKVMIETTAADAPVA
jgi:uncharacterized protein (DUF427 family)